jgi:hypothetical protein
MKGIQQEVGDLFVTESAITVKLMPSKKSASMPIGWFVNGEVTNHRRAAKDIAGLVAKLQGKKRIVRGLTLMTDRGTGFDISSTGLHEAVSSAGFEPIR